MSSATSPASATSPCIVPDSLSNETLTAKTVPKTVMAEQISHNVVISESTGVTPVDDTALTSATEALDGTQHPISQPTLATSLKPSAALSDETIPRTVTGQTNLHGANNTADPSAGDAAELVTRAPVTATAHAAEEKDGKQQDDLVNGTHHEVNTDDGLRDGANTPDPSVDHSVNSDTDLSRGDVTELSKGEAHHARTNSVKKPTTFSKVSVTKTFMAKAASPAPAAVKIGEKPSPVGAAALPVAKPRLVAKSGSGLQNMHKPRMGSESASGPDASKVWNKNRPTPLPPPKHFTDEELKQQYGIHLATRLQTADDGKESNWADIDDDEDDWAPEAVVWMDGTKSTVASADAPAEPEAAQPQPIAQGQAQGLPQGQPQPQAPGQPAIPTEIAKAAAVTPRRQIDLGPQKTILKPGIAAQQARQQIGGSATPSSDKPSLKAKSPAPTPSRSPWAALPPVDAVSPIIPPTYQPPTSTHAHTSLPSQDARTYDSHVPQQPAREIAADTFDRSWRDGEGGSRELFNSANGRYEPVPENGRRASMKQDASFRKPAVLQRPSHGSGPAEPSAAFQTRSTIQMDGNGSWNRRRGSSISQGSLPPGRRVSMSKGSDFASERRGSTATTQDSRASPQSTRAEPGRPNFAQQSAWDQQMPARPEPGTETEDPVQVQERIMREKRAAKEQEIKRRKEIEEREAAAVQERLKARIAALEGAGKSRKERQAEAAAAPPAVETPATTTQEQPPTTGLPSAPAESSSDVKTTVPVSQADGPSQISPDAGLASLAPLPPKPQTAGLPERQVSSGNHTERQIRGPLSPRENTRAPFGQQSSSYKPAPSFSSPGDRKSQPFNHPVHQVLSSDPFAPWGATSNGNVWGSSGIGNGTFEKASSFAPMPISQQNSALPPPPGMGRQTTSARISPSAQEARSPNVQQQVAEQLRTFAPPGIDSRPDASWGQGRAGLSPAPGLGRQAHLPGPIAPPSRSQQQSNASRNEHIPSWNVTPQGLPHEYSAEQPNVAVTVPEVPRGTIKETFKRTSAIPGKLGGPRRYEQTEYTVHDTQGSRSVSTHGPLPPNAQSQPSGLVSPLIENTVRIPDGSRIPTHGGSATQQPPIGPPTTYLPPHLASQRNSNPAAQVSRPDSDDPSLPPPGTSSHPVNSGDARKPQVRLPPPPPVVKLPPQSPGMQHQEPNAMPHMSGPSFGAPKPLVQSKDWQARFNGLFNRTPIQTEVPPSPPGTPPKPQDVALAVASSSKAPLHDVPAAVSATVSLPHGKGVVNADGFATDDGADVVSKPAIEQMFNEELSFGSLPRISMPLAASYNGAKRHESESAHNMLNMGFGASAPLLVESQSQPLLDFKEVKIFWNNPHGIYVKIASTPLNNKLVKNRNDKGKSMYNKERKASSKVHKGKGKNTTAPSSPATNSASNETSKRASPQKGPTPVPSSPATPSNSANSQKKPASAKTMQNRNTPVKSS